MFKLYLLCLAFTVALASQGVALGSGSLTRSVYTCLAQQNISLVVLGIWDQAGNVPKDFLLNYIYAKDSGIAKFDTMVIINDTFAATDICNGVAHALPASFKGNVWLNVQNGQGFWSQDIDDRISYLETVAKTCGQHGLTVGVYSDAATWATVMGSQGAGSDTLKALPVWYFNDNNVQDFSDFDYAGFGTWDKATMKQYSTNQYTCNFYVAGYQYYEA